MRFPVISFVPLALIGALAGCSGPVPAPSPRPAPAPVPAPAPPPSPTPSPLAADWRDWPVTEGTWAWRQDARGSIALFGRAGADAELTVRCDTGRGRIYISRRGDHAQKLTIRTSSMSRTIAGLPTGGSPAYVAFELMPRDTLLDAMGHTRGRFAIQVERMAPLVVPAWAEFLRVVEDCR